MEEGEARASALQGRVEEARAHLSSLLAALREGVALPEGLAAALLREAEEPPQMQQGGGSGSGEEQGGSRGGGGRAAWEAALASFQQVCVWGGGGY